MPMNKYNYQLFIDNQALRELSNPTPLIPHSNNHLITKCLYLLMKMFMYRND